MSVYRRKGKDGRETKVFYYDFIRDGRRFSGSTGETSRRKAELAEKRIREQCSARRDETSIDGAFKAFWDEKGQHYAEPATVFWRMEMLQDLLESILKSDGLPPNLAEVRTRHLVQYKQQRRAMPNRRKKLPEPATINREIQLLRTIMRHAIRIWEAEIALPAFGSVLMDEPEGVVVEVPAEVHAAIKAQLRPDFHDVLDFLILVGNRTGNVLQRGSRILSPEMVDLENRELTFWLKSKKPGGRRLVLPITEPMLVLLANNLGHHPDAVFTYIAKTTRAGRIRGQR
jgi:hypothetical protein